MVCFSPKFTNLCLHVLFLERRNRSCGFTHTSPLELFSPLPPPQQECAPHRTKQIVTHAHVRDSYTRAIPIHTRGFKMRGRVASHLQSELFLPLSGAEPFPATYLCMLFPKSTPCGCFLIGIKKKHVAKEKLKTIRCGISLCRCTALNRYTI